MRTVSTIEAERHVAPGSDAPMRSAGPWGKVVAVAERPWASPLLALVALACWWLSLHAIHPYGSIGAAGLAPQLPLLWWTGTAVAAAAVVVELARPVPRLGGMVLSLLVLAVILHGTLPATEPVPRFSTAYYTAGFSDYLARTGQALPRLDARMSWPGLFAGAGLTAEAMRVAPLWFLRWTPLVLEVAYLVPVKALANTFLRSPRARWAAPAIFLSSNWIDQDYFSAQGVNLLIFLAVAVIAVRSFAAFGERAALVDRLAVARPVRWAEDRALRWLRLPYGAEPGELPAEPTSTATRAGLLVLLVALIGASVVSHQITPAAICLVLFALAATGRTRLRTLWILVAVLVWAWLCWEAHTYWAGHLSKIFGSIGQVGGTLNSSVGSRLQSSSFGRQLVQGGRLAAAGVTWAGAGVGFWSQWRRGRSLWTPVLIGVAPILVAGAVSYGGEVALRVLLFSLAPAAILIAALLDVVPLRRTAVAACLVVAALLLALFPLDRYGNEAFEAIAPGDLAAAVWIHEHVKPGAEVMVVNRDEPLYYTHVGIYKLVSLGEIVYVPQPELARHLPVTHVPTYIYLTRSEYEYGLDFVGDPQGWLDALVNRLLSTPYVTVAHRTSTAWVLRLSKPPTKFHPKVGHRPRPTPTVQPKPTTTTKPKPTTTTRPKPTTTTRPKPTTTTRPKPTTTTTSTSTTTTTTTTSTTTTTTTAPTSTTGP